jgi:nicotinamidase-related amidase
MISPDGTEALARLADWPAVLTIDVHRGHLDPAVATLPLSDEASAALVARVVPMLAAFRDRGVPVIHVTTTYRDSSEILSNPYWRFQSGRVESARGQIAEHNLDGLPGLELMPGVEADGDRVVRTKKRYDCFVGTDLEFLLRAGRHDSVFLVGVNTNSCVLATAIAASVRDFAVFVLDDGVDTMHGRDLHEAAETLIDASFGWVVTSANALDRVGRTLDAKTADRLDKPA